MKSNLLIKSSNNESIAAIAEKNKLYDVAISRYYYSAFQKIIYILKKNDTYDIKEIDVRGKGSHINTFQYFLEKFMDDIEPEYLAYLNYFYALKSFRHDADYNEKICDNKNNDYNLNFKLLYNLFNEALENII